MSPTDPDNAVAQAPLIEVACGACIAGWVVYRFGEREVDTRCIRCCGTGLILTEKS